MAPAVRPKGIRLRTSFATENAFVAAFHGLCDESSIFVPTDKVQYPASTDCYFSIELADETPMLRGLGVVIESWSSDENSFGHPGIHVRITQLTTTSESMFDRLLAARPAALHRGPRVRTAPMTQQQWGSMIAPPTMEMEAEQLIDVRPPSDADAEATKPAKPITREMGSVSIPAPNTASTPARSKPVSMSAGAPVAEIDEKTTETTRYEDYLRLPAAQVVPGRPSIAVGSAPPPAPAVTRPAAAADSAPARAVTPFSSDPPRPATGPQLPTEPPRIDSVAWSAEADRLPSRWWQVAWWRDGQWKTVWRASVDWWRSGQWKHTWWANRRVGGTFGVGILVGVLFTLLLRPSHPVRPPAIAANVPAQKQDMAACPQVAPPAVAVADATDEEPASPPTHPPHGKAHVKVAAATAPAKSNHPAATRIAPTKALAKPVPKVATTSPKVATTAPKPAAKPPLASKPAPKVATTAPKPAAKPPLASKPAPKVATTAPKAAPKPTTKPASKPAPTAKRTNVASAKPAPKRKRGGCSSLDCI